MVKWAGWGRVFFKSKSRLDECESTFQLVDMQPEERIIGYATNEQSKLPATSLPPITSLSWNAVSPNSVVTCSIDTTATLWDITNQTAVTQLIAHDKAVYDL